MIRLKKYDLIIIFSNFSLGMTIIMKGALLAQKMKETLKEYVTAHKLQDCYVAILLL